MDPEASKKYQEMMKKAQARAAPDPPPNAPQAKTNNAPQAKGKSAASESKNANAKQAEAQPKDQ
jgi:hypothetical protein